MNDQTYINVDDEGNEISNYQRGGVASKWREPKTDFERNFLQAVGLSQFPNDKYKKRHDQDGNETSSRVMSGKDIALQVRLIEKEMAPIFNVKAMPKLPKEYVEEKVEWAKRLRKEGQYRSAAWLISVIRNPDSIEKWKNRFLLQQENERKEQKERPVYRSSIPAHLLGAANVEADDEDSEL